MNQFEKMEVFVASEDACRAIGYSDEVEVWANGDDLSGELILRGFNAWRDDLLQAENECLRKDVEFYKNRNTVEKTVEVEREREFEMDEDDFEDLLIDFNRGDLSLLEVAEQLKVTLVKPEPTNAEKWDAIVDEWHKTVSPSPLSPSFGEWIDQRGVKAPDA